MTELTKEQGKNVFNIDGFMQKVPEGIIKSWKTHVIQFPDDILPNQGIGVDPGLKLGVAYVGGTDIAYSFRCYVNRGIVDTVNLLAIFQAVPELFVTFASISTPTVVEGPAHNARYGQPLLGQIRGALLLGFHNAGFESVSEVAPLQIRKRVFGEGRIQPVEFWQSAGFIPADKDSADALSMAICAGL